MAFLTLKSPFTAEERAQRRRLIISDSLSLAMLVVITALLAVAANAIYQSYASHQATLSQRWRARGEEALKQGKPLAAIGALRSALALEPSQRRIEIDLAEALAAAGRTPEAVSYFNTLAESEPGDGMINLQLARLAVRQGNAKQALGFYQRAIYGNWEGDGYVRRREVRLEMVRYLIARRLYPRARNELLVAAGNAPASDTGLLIRIARLMEQAQDPGSALHFYKLALAHRPPSLEAMEGAGRAAFALGSYREARQYLEEAVNSSGPAAGQASRQSRDLLRDATRLLLLYPSPELPARARALRVLVDRQIARRRLDSCVSSFTAEAAASPVSQAPAQSQRGPSLLQHSLKSLASRFARGPAKKSVGNPPPGPPSPPPAETLANLQARWKQQPEKITLSSMEGDPGLAESQMQLIYDTERITQQVCGAPTGDDALLLKIAQAPGMAPGLASGMVERQ